MRIMLTTLLAMLLTGCITLQVTASGGLFEASAHEPARQPATRRN